MKKLFSLFAAAALTISMAACAGSADAETSKPTDGSTAKPSIQATTPSTAPSTVPPTTEPSFKEIVLVDNDNVTVKVTAVDADSIWGYTLKVFIENKTDRELMFTADKVSVNGYMCDPFWATTVDAGKKANDEISFSKSSFEDNGIESVEEITLTLRIYDNDDWTADDIVNETVTIKP